MFVRRLALILAALATAGGVTACSSEATLSTTTKATDSPSAAAPTSGATPTSAASATATASATAASPTVKIDTVEGRQVLVDQEGRSLYVFTEDAENMSNCYDDCAAKWPPLWGKAEAGDGVEAGDLGTLTRKDGKIQVTYFGKPLYYYAADTTPGQATGEGVGGVWWLVDAQGKPVQ